MISVMIDDIPYPPPPIKVKTKKWKEWWSVYDKNHYTEYLQDADSLSVSGLMEEYDNNPDAIIQAYIDDKLILNQYELAYIAKISIMFTAKNVFKLSKTNFRKVVSACKKSVKNGEEKLIEITKGAYKPLKINSRAYELAYTLPFMKANRK